MNHIEENNIEVRQLIEIISAKRNYYDQNYAVAKVLNAFEDRYNYYKNHSSLSYGVITLDYIFQDILHTLYKSIINFQNIENNYQYFCLRDKDFVSNKRSHLYGSLDALLSTYNSSDFKIFFPKLIQTYIPMEHTKKINWTKHHTRAKEDEYELLIRDNLPEFLKHSKIEYLKKANYLHVINFLQKKYNLSIGQEIAKVILKYLKDDLENEQDDEPHARKAL